MALPIGTRSRTALSTRPSGYVTVLASEVFCVGKKRNPLIGSACAPRNQRAGWFKHFPPRATKAISQPYRKLHYPYRKSKLLPGRLLYNRFTGLGNSRACSEPEGLKTSRFERSGGVLTLRGRVGSGRVGSDPILEKSRKIVGAG